MRISYDRDKDIMLLEVSREKIDYAEEAGPIIVHFSKKKHPVLLEILDASEFISEITSAGMKMKQERFASISI